MQPSVIHSSRSGRDFQPWMMTKDQVEKTPLKSLQKIGIGVEKLARSSFGMDSIQQGLTTPSIPALIQNLQTWLPGVVAAITAARKIDEIIGKATIGAWHMEQVILNYLENTGAANIYGDYTNVPLASWNLNFERRTIVRGELGFRVAPLEEARSAEQQVNSAAMKRASTALALSIFRNLVGFFGYNNGANLTYGFMNDPGLPSYIAVAAGASGSTLWSRKTMLEIIADIRAAVVQLRTQSQDTIDPEKVDLTLVLPTDSVDYVTVTSDLGYSVRQWMKETYPRMRIVSAPQLNLANGGSNVFYLFADSVQDQVSTDDGKTWIQPVPADFQVVGVAKEAKGQVEDFTNATAGAFLKRPYAVVRYTGI